jgi:predicted esterase YcpF (UPF0227 family)
MMDNAGMKIIYFHGWNSSGNSDKVNALKRHCEVFAPKIAFESFQETHDSLFAHSKSIVDFYGSDEVVLIGSSLGGYWAEHIGPKLGVNTLLVNPSTRPKETLKLDYPDLAPKGFGYRTILLTQDDEVLDHTIARDLYQGIGRVVVYEKGGHRFADVDELYKQAEIAYCTICG